MKNYVKEYKGYKVPEGATKFLDLSRFEGDRHEFYKVVKGRVWYFDYDDKVWAKATMKANYSKAIELPEAPQEWNGEGLPPVGTLCKISADGFEYLFSAASNELSPITENTELVVVGHCTRHDNGAKCVTLMATDSAAARGFTTINPDFITPIKTQQEKDREAFIEAARSIVKLGMRRAVIDEVAGIMFDAGFTAPKDEYND